MTLLKDVIDIPERLGSDDYVLRLTDSVGGASHAALEAYVVTDHLAEAFDGALDIVAGAIREHRSVGAFLTGSFGSGKSHFMAVLHALLAGNPEARGKDGLVDVVAKHDADLDGKCILPLAFHMLDSESFEQAIFSGYLRQIRELHPDVTLPALHHTDQLLQDAIKMRERMGDAAFFEGLNGGAGDMWSGLDDNTWDADSFDRAVAAAPSATIRQDLVGDLVANYFGSFGTSSDWVDLDTGLAAISAHAERLGYDAVVLFLDELVLWLAFLVRDGARFSRESQKLTKLVEASTGNRKIPLISFIARQFDLRQFIADAGTSGANQQALEQGFKFQEGRFGKIVLGDDNLPYVANRRLLQPRDDHARDILKEAFDQLERTPQVWDVLLDGINTDDDHRGSDEAAFRLTYPFSPALMSTLKSLASVMQRERTALKVMQQMLVDRRDTLTVDDVIPVGDAYDHVVSGSHGQALDQQAANLFRTADRLYTEKFQPLLLEAHRLGPSALEHPETLPDGYRSDDRIVKTMLLSAVAPRVPALKELTASRLASLNHGSIRSPLAGGEANVIAGKVRTWANAIPEIQVDEGSNPIIRVRVADVDYEGVIERAKVADSDSASRTFVTRMILDALDLGDIREDVSGTYTINRTWRGSVRPVELFFGNVRDTDRVQNDHFRPRNPDAWRIVVDHPFDVTGKAPKDDHRRIDELRAHGVECRTLIWVPHFLSERTHHDLRRLVIIDWVLTSDDRWNTRSDHLSESERPQARAILESMRESLRSRVRQSLLQAYGIERAESGVLHDAGASDPLVSSLDRSLAPTPPRARTFAAALDDLLDQAFSASWPRHPEFQPGNQEVTRRELQITLEHMTRAVEDRDRRVRYIGDPKPVRRVSEALEVGKAAETHFLFGDEYFGSWGTSLQSGVSRLGKSDTDPVTVGDLRQIIDALAPTRGLQHQVSDLVIHGWALLRQRGWFHYGAAIPPPDLGKADPSMELRAQRLPGSDHYATACDRAAKIFGIRTNPHRTPRSVAELAGSLREEAAQHESDVRRLVTSLGAVLDRVHVGREVDRLRTAEEAVTLLDALRLSDDADLIDRFGAMQLQAGEAKLGRSITQADSVLGALDAIVWESVDHAIARSESDDLARTTVAPLLTALRHDQLAKPLTPEVNHVNDSLVKWLVGDHKPAPAPSPQIDPDDVHLPMDQYEGSTTVAAGRDRHKALEELREVIDAHPDRQIEVRWRIL